MIADSSAVVAVMLREPGYERLAEHLDGALTIGIGAPTLVETGIVLASRAGGAGSAELARFVRERHVIVIPFGNDHRIAALEAFLRYGKGRHPARLNFGDCMSYATARLAGEPLLCIGNDFAQTDLPLVS